MKGDLDPALFMRIMARLGETRGENPLYPPTTGEFMDLVSPDADMANGEDAVNYLHRHVDFLRERGFLKTNPAGIYMGLRLTTRGQMFVQPELAEFGEQPMLPQVVKSLENQIQILTYPQQEKDGMLYRLRDAVAKQAPDVIAKVIAEIVVKISTGQ